MRQRLPLPVAASIVLLAIVISSCSSDSPTTPTAPSTPPSSSTPPTQAPPTTAAMDGNVTEQAPTADQRVAGATIRIASGSSAGEQRISDGAGFFFFPSLATGTFNVEVSAPNYEPLTTSVSLNTSGPRTFRLRPVRRDIVETLTGSVSGGDSACGGSIGNSPCQRFSFGVHHDGVAEAVLSWGSGINDLDLELWRGSTQLARSIGVSRNEERVSANVQAGGTYQWRVVYWSGSTVQSFSLQVRRPN